MTFGYLSYESTTSPSFEKRSQSLQFLKTNEPLDSEEHIN